MWSPRRLEGLSEQYCKIDFHDWSLEELSVVYLEAANEHRVLMVVSEPTDPPAQQFRITLGHARGVRASVDLVAKALLLESDSFFRSRAVAERPELADALDANFHHLQPERPDRQRLKSFRNS
jgi:hypothetical protein